jgi:hypothetical protein
MTNENLVTVNELSEFLVKAGIDPIDSSSFYQSRGGMM